MAGKGINLNNQDIRVALLLAKAYYYFKKYDKGISVLSPFMFDDKKPLEYYILLGQGYSALGRHREALGYFEQAITSFGLNYTVLNEIGECYLHLGEKE